MYECPNCGGNLKFDIPSQQLACAFCDTHVNPYEIKKETDAVSQDYFEVTIFTCPQCGGEILSEDNEAAAFCSFCGASTILSSRISKERRPKYIIPFKKTKEDCKRAYAKKMRGAFFVPKELKDAKYIDGFRGIYMPYWTYQLTQNKQVNLNGKKSHREGDYIITRHYALKGDLDAYYLGYARDASTSFYDNISEALAPFDAKELVNFTPTYLSGFYADTADVDEEMYMDDVMELAEESTYDRLRTQKEFKEYGIDAGGNENNLHGKLGTVCRSADSTMYPVWFMSYRNGDRVAYATVNGQTGKVVADMPIDIKRYLIASLLLAIVIFVLLNLFFTFKPMTLLILTCILVVGTAMLYALELNAIYRKENNTDDEAVTWQQEQIKAAQGVTEESEDFAKPKKKKKVKKAKRKLGAVEIIIILSFAMTLGPSLLGLAIVLAVPIMLVGAVVCCVMGMKNRKKVDGVKKTPGFIISIATVVIGLLIIFVRPVSDLYYYGGALLTLIAVLFNLVDLMRNYNRLAMRRLPQFDKQGGDDRA